MKQFLKSFPFTPIRLLAGRVYFRAIATFYYLSGKKQNRLVPDRRISLSQVEYNKQGENPLTYLRELTGLKPSHAILDLECGTGRIAFSLTGFLGVSGSYDGLDTDKNNIDWCKKYIAEKYPNFKFQCTGPRNQLHSNSGPAENGNNALPFQDEKFDFVFVNSVFTHRMPAEVIKSISEICRVMKSGASCLISMYIVNCESEDLMIKKPTQTNFPVNKGFYRLQSLQDGDVKVAYDEEWLLEKLENAGLKMQSIKYGNWCGRKFYLDYEDLIICSKV
jgi:SAM-dependent methyltransferase